MRILVVDDEEHLRRVMRLTLETSGYDVTEAADGESALRAFGDGASFDAVLLDQKMPGIDGLETLKRLKLRRSDARVIVVTAYASVELAVDAMKLGATDFVRKPMTPETLRHAVTAALAKSDVTRPLSSEAPPEAIAAAPGSPEEPIPREVWTTNGFFVRSTKVVHPADESTGTDYYFLVRRGREAEGIEVVVTIHPKARNSVTRQSRRAFSPEGAFWRSQAETALLNYLWSEAALPESGRLVLSRMPGSTMNAALGWTAD
jgi:DNA-binding response OmpR family regulator